MNRCAHVLPPTPYENGDCDDPSVYPARWAFADDDCPDRRGSDGSGATHGGEVVAGAATITQEAGATQITQTTPNAVIDWQGFSLHHGGLVTFDQPSADAAVLNRVTGAAPSRIDGTLSANGQVFFINPNGVLVG